MLWWFQLMIYINYIRANTLYMVNNNSQDLPLLHVQWYPLSFLSEVTNNIRVMAKCHHLYLGTLRSKLLCNYYSPSVLNYYFKENYESGSGKNNICVSKCVILYKLKRCPGNSPIASALLNLTFRRKQWYLSIEWFS